MTYDDYLKIIFNALPMYQRQGKAAYKADLGVTLVIDTYFNHPHHMWKSIHVAGTNGKGSVSHMLASVLQEAGYKTGLYISPHLKDFRERIRINGEMISKDYVVGFMDKHFGFFKSQEASFFEMTVALAFEYFKDEKIDAAVVETGMGGRLDSTNIITPLVSVITNIGYDHTAFLGNTITDISKEKAGIIKKGIPVVLGSNQQEVKNVVKSTADEKNSLFVLAPKKYNVTKVDEDAVYSYWKVKKGDGSFVLKSDLKGNYQHENMVTALATLDQLEILEKLNTTAIRRGIANVIKNTGLAGRWQKMASHPDVYCDVAHNKEGLEVVMKQLKSVSKSRIYIVLGVVSDKILEDILPLFPGDAYYIFTEAKIPRALPSAKLAQKAAEYGLHGEVCSDVFQSYQQARKLAKPDDTIFIGGSTFTVAEVL
ncbi:MAG: folylpolyglutamate synthase/dihydrofolate synthase family protein [Bacteroidota bacterium]|nr:folylpolyglutamate synthase/dihydrofolate synthase family protein [Bacteroidota bacterium]